MFASQIGRKISSKFLSIEEISTAAVLYWLPWHIHMSLHLSVWLSNCLYSKHIQTIFNICFVKQIHLPIIHTLVINSSTFLHLSVRFSNYPSHSRHIHTYPNTFKIHSHTFKTNSRHIHKHSNYTQTHSKYLNTHSKHIQNTFKHIQNIFNSFLVKMPIIYR